MPSSLQQETRLEQELPSLLAQQEEKHLEFAQAELAANCSLSLNEVKQLPAATESQKPPKGAALRHAGFALIATLALALLAWTLKPSINIYRFWKASMNYTDFGPVQMPELKPKIDLLAPDYLGRADERSQLILTKNWQALTKLEPQNPLWYQLLTIQEYQINQILPENLEQKQAQLDPDNGFLLLWNTTKRYSDQELFEQQDREEEGKPKTTSHNSSPKTLAEVQAKPASDYLILEPKAFAQAIEGIYAALEKPTLNSYGSELMAQIYHALPPRETTAEQFAGVFLKAESFQINSAEYLWVSKLLTAEAQRCMSAVDLAGFERAVSAWKTLCERQQEQSPTLTEHLVLMTILSIPQAEFAEGYHHFGLTDQARQFEHQNLLLRQFRFQREKNCSSNTPEAISEAPAEFIPLMQRAALSSINALPLATSQSSNKLTRDELRPSVRTERAWISHFSLLACALLIIFFWIGNQLFPAYAAKLQRHLSSQLLGLIPWQKLLLLGLIALLPSLGLVLLLRHGFHADFPDYGLFSHDGSIFLLEVFLPLAALSTSFFLFRLLLQRQWSKLGLHHRSEKALHFCIQIGFLLGLLSFLCCWLVVSFTPDQEEFDYDFFFLNLIILSSLAVIQFLLATIPTLVHFIEERIGCQHETMPCAQKLPLSTLLISTQLTHFWPLAIMSFSLLAIHQASRGNYWSSQDTLIPSTHFNEIEARISQILQLEVATLKASTPENPAPFFVPPATPPSTPSHTTSQP